MDFQRVLVAIAEPQRYRIVTLLAEGPRTVGEIASALSATKWWRESYALAWIASKRRPSKWNSTSP